MTAVEFLEEALSIHLTHEQKMQFIGLFHQVLEMEKQQIIEAYRDGRTDQQTKDGFYNRNSETYYNETYKSTKK
jgi:hypothetical protein